MAADETVWLCGWRCRRNKAGRCSRYCTASVGGNDFRPVHIWERLHQHFAAHVAAYEARSALVLSHGDWIEYRISSTRWVNARISKVVNSKTINLMRTNRRTRQTVRIRGVDTARCRARGGSAYLRARERLRIGRDVELVGTEHEVINEVQYLYRRWCAAKRLAVAEEEEDEDDDEDDDMEA